MVKAARNIKRLVKNNNIIIVGSADPCGQCVSTKKEMFFLKSINRVKIADGVHFSTIYDDKFKRSRIAVFLTTELDRNMCSAYTAVSGLLSYSTKKYPTFLEFGKKLEELYGLAINSSSVKRGDSQTISFSASFLNDSYSLDGESICEESARILCDALFDPNAQNGAFAKVDFEQEQRQLLDNVDAKLNDKSLYAQTRYLETICENEKHGIDPLGTREQIEALTPENTYEAYLRLMKIAEIEIFCLGSNDTENVKKMFAEKFSSIEGRAPIHSEQTVVRRAEKVKKKTDRLDVQQSKLIMGFRTDCADPDDAVDACTLMSVVLGGSAHSKLFNNVREKLSLCYYCSSSFMPMKGIMTVMSGVQKENIEKTQEAILNEIEEMKKGNITDEELEAAKLTMSNNYITLNDSAASTQTWYISQIFRGSDRTPEQQMEAINAVTKEDVVAAANRLTLDTVYVLTGDDKEGE